MPTDVVMPQMGESIFEGTITKWLKKIGDRVEKDEPLFEISTDKVDAEIPSPVAGVLAEIRIPEGATVEVHTVVAVVADSVPAAVSRQESAPKAQPDQAAPSQAAPSQAAPSQAAPSQAEPSQPEPTQPEPTQGDGTEVVMPQMGESIFEGTIVKWLKKVGDRIEKDEPLFEISTDKVDAEIPSPVAGILTEIRAPEGATVEVYTVVALIGSQIASSAGSGASAPPPSAAQAGALKSPQAPDLPSQTLGQPVAEASAPPNVEGRRIRSSPLVRRIAKENQVDLARVSGSSSNGRICKEDILRYLDAHESGAVAGPGASAALTAAAQGAAQARPAAPGDQVAPLSRMRAIIAERMVESLKISPHVYTVYKVDMTRVVRLRERLKAGFEQRHGVKLTFMPFIATAAIAALRKHPIVNASLAEGAIHYHANIHLGIAVALEWGLIVPVVRDAGQRAFADLARTIADLAARARAKKLNPDEAGGSTFTLTNAGLFGDEFSTPIINQPESAILCISGLHKEPVVLTDREGNDAIAIRSMQHFTLGFDHRLIDGADGCKFMLELKRVLENWDQQIA